MAKIVTNYLSRKYNGKYYYIRMFANYTVDNTDYYTKKVTFSAGFEIKTRNLGMNAIELAVSDGTNSASKKMKFSAKTSSPSVTYITQRTWSYARKSTAYKKTISLNGTFGSTRFSGKKTSLSIPITVEALGESNSMFTARRTTGNNVELAISVNATGTLSVAQPTIKKGGTALSGLTWYYGDTAISFPHTTEANSVTYKAITTADILHDFTFNYTGNIGQTEFSTDSIAYATVTPEWKGTLTVTGKPLPEKNVDGTARIKIYRDLGDDAKIEIPNSDGWVVSGADNNWSVAIDLSELYVDDPTTTSTSSDLIVEYTNYTDLADDALEQKRAIFETSRNCGYTTGLANNVFIGGCTYPDYKSRVWYSYVNNPTYFPDTNYIEVGSNDTSVMGLVKVGDYLGIIKQSKTTDSAVYLAYATSFDDDTTFATKSCVSGVGALGKFCFNVLGDETLFLSPNGIMAIEPSEDEQSRVKNRSYFVDGKLLEEPFLDTAYSFVYDKKYWLCVNNKAFVLDGTQQNSWGNERTNLVYEAYYLENIPAKCMASFGDELWFSDDSGNICRFKHDSDDNAYTDNGEVIFARWSTIADDDGSLQYYKTLQKKGSVVSLLPEEGTTASVYIRKDEEDRIYIGDEEVPSGAELPSDFFPKKKIKKYKRLQFIVEDESDNPLGVNKIVKSYSLGNYAKR